MVVLRRRTPSAYEHRSPALRTKRVEHGGLLGAVVCLTLLAATLAGCGGHSSNGADGTPARASGASSGGFDGDHLDRPVTLTASSAAATFRSSAGDTTTLAALQKDRLMLVYFGYTHCPDVCPTTMADLGTALRQLPAQVQQATQVVFVTSDPARDTVPVMRAWLANFDAGLARRFIGLTASAALIDRVATSVGVPLSPPMTHPDGTVSVEHGAQTLAFVHGRASVLWLAGTTAAQYAHDINALTVHGGPL